MPKDKQRGAGSGTLVEVVVPARTRGMLGWAMLAPGETSEPHKSHGEYDVKEQNIVPGRRKRPQEDSASRGPEYEQDSKRRASERHNLSRQLSEDEMRREIARLRIEHDLYALAESEETRRLRAEVKRLDNVKAELNRTVNRLMSRVTELTSGEPETDKDTLLRNKERVIHDRISEIKDLEIALSRCFEQQAIRLKTCDIDLPTSASGVGDAMKAINLGVISTADLLSSCLHLPNKIPRRSAVDSNLRHLLMITGNDNKALRLMPDLALRAILFQIICEQILCSDMWAALHTGGFMLRAYQRAIQHGCEYRINRSVFPTTVCLHL